MNASDLHSYQPKDGHGLKHDPFNAIIGPRPIGWISSRNASGHVNLAPYSFFNAFNYTPPLIGFSSIGDVIADGVATGEFEADDVALAANCVCMGMVGFFHPQMIAQCADKPGPSLDQMIDFVLAGLAPRG